MRERECGVGGNRREQDLISHGASLGGDPSYAATQLFDIGVWKCLILKGRARALLPRCRLHSVGNLHFRTQSCLCDPAVAALPVP